MPSTKAGVISSALVHLGRNEIADIADTTDPYVRLAVSRYDQIRDALLRRYLWNFADRFATLAGTEIKPPQFGYSFSADLPAGGKLPRCVRVTHVEGCVEWIVQGRKILTKSSGPFTIAYVAIVTEDEFDPLFSEIFALDLALVLIARIPPEGAKARLADLRRERRTLSRSARLADAQEASPTKAGGGSIGSWANARRPR